MLAEGCAAGDRRHHLADLDLGNGDGVLRRFHHRTLLDGHEQLIGAGRHGEAEGGGEGDEQCADRSSAQPVAILGVSILTEKRTFGLHISKRLL